MANLKIIEDPLSKQKFARDVDAPGSLYEAYTEPTPAAAAPAPTAPIVSPIQVKRTVDPNVKAAESYLGTFKAPETSDQIAERLRQSSQGLIDSTNQMFDDKVAEKRQVGDERLAMDNAVSVLSGLMGSTEAVHSRGKTLDKNEKEIAAINNERALELSKVYGQISKEAREEVIRQREDATKSANDIITRRTQSQTKAIDNLKLMAQGGLVDFDSFKASPQNKEVYDFALDSVGGSEEALRGLFAVNRPKDQLVGTPTRIGAKYVQAYQNPLTGKVKYETLDLGFDLPIEYNNFQKVGDNLVAIPDNWDGDISKLKTIYAAPSGGVGLNLPGTGIAPAAAGTKSFSKEQLVQAVNKLKLNESQSNAAAYSIRLIEANKNINDMIGDGYDPTTISAAIGRTFRSDNARELGREVENFIRAQLRKESGATITPEELAGGKNIYDPSGVLTNEKDLKQTGETRQQAIQSMIAQAGPAGQYINEYFKSEGLGGSPAAASDPTSAPVGSTVEINGVQYKKVGDDAFEPL